MKLIVWFAGNPVAANLLMLVIIAGGLLSLPTIQRYTTPQSPKDQLQIEIAYPSAGPGEVEHALCIPIEEAIHDLEGVKNITSVADQALCRVNVEFDPAIGSTRFQAAVQARMDAITAFPKEAEKLKITELKTGSPAVIVAVRGEVGKLILQQQRDKLEAKLSKHPDIGILLSWPKTPFELSIEIKESDLRRYGLGFEEVAESIRSTSKNIPAGELKNSDGKFLLRSKGQAMSVADYAAIELRSSHHGSRLSLGDIAHIHETVSEQDLLVRIDGKAAVEVIVLPKDQIVATVEAVNKVIDEFRPGLPDGVDITTWDDWSKYYEQHMSMLMDDAISGFILVFLILMLTLRFHLALWVSSGILISIFGALWAMPVFGISLNTYSITALILVLGVVVDDAIIVGENIYTHQQQGRLGYAGAVSGTLEVTPLVVLMVLSTMIAFIPGLFLPGLSGNLMHNVSLVVILTLVFSMVEALLILPAHLAASPDPNKKLSFKVPVINWMQDRVDAGLQRFIDRIYIPLLKALLHFRYITVAGFVVLLLIVSALVVSGRIPSVMDAQVNDYYLLAKLEYPPGTPFIEVDSQVMRLERIANEIRADMNMELATAASGGLRDSFQHIVAVVEDNKGFVDIEISIDERVRSRMDEIKKQWQERFGDVPAGATLSFQTFWPRDLGVATPSAAKPIELMLTAPDPADQSVAGEILKARLSSYAGVHSVSGSMQTGKPELRLKLKPAAEFHGLTMLSLGEQVRNGFFGLEVQRFFKDRDEVRVMLRFPYSHHRSREDLYSMPISLASGGTVPFSVVAEAEYTPGFASITRQNRERIQIISADIYKNEVNVENVLADLRATLIPELEGQYPGLKIEAGQSRQKQEEAMSALWKYGALAVLGIYALLAVPLRSYMQPLLIMLAIPFGFVGAVGGHLLLGIPLTLESYVALFAVGGIVINDSLILIAHINKTLQKGLTIYEAATAAGKARFRPIFLTTLTTSVGLLPLISEQSSHAEKILPMAVTLAFGVLFSTLVTLLLIPISCVVVKEGRPSTSV
jgi:multidrug efflux pump subunit AcrB